MTCAASAGEMKRGEYTDGEAAVAEVGAAAGASAKRWSTMPLRSERRDCCKGVGAGSESEPTWGAPVPTGFAGTAAGEMPMPTGYVPVLVDEVGPAAGYVLVPTGFAAGMPAGGTMTADGPPTPTDTGLEVGRWSRR